MKWEWGQGDSREKGEEDDGSERVRGGGRRAEESDEREIQRKKRGWKRMRCKIGCRWRSRDEELNSKDKRWSWNGTKGW